jgi:Cytochrome c7 and related cytochrome c/Class III cytochrome C family
VRGLLLITALLCAVFIARAQDKPSAATPPTTPASGTTQSSGTPTIVNPPPAPAQPVAFSHKKHAGDTKLACNFCHEPSRSGDTLVMPQAAKCMQCHAAVATDKPDIKRIAEAAQNNQPLQWVRIYRVPSFVSFSHKTHTTAGAQCEDCHGPVAERETLSHEKDLSMGGCISCHNQKSAPTGCDTCHQLNSVHLQPSAAASDAALVARLTHTPTHKAEVSALSGLP